MSRISVRMTKYLFLVLSVNVFWVGDAFAYLDPGTGSMLVSAVIGLFATAIFLLKNLQYKLKALVSRLFHLDLAKEERQGIVFYSEGAQYWSTFEPALKALDELGVSSSYWTSGEDDPGLSFRSETVETKYIGKGYRAHARLNILAADVCVLSTPGLDVLQIKRSKNVSRYVYIAHAISDIGTYRQYSFDYFDVVLTSGEHQITALRQLEQQRGTKEKVLLRSGCNYMDGLLARATEAKSVTGRPATHVLLAPTWGPNGLLSRFGSALPKVLLEAGFNVVIRPHPQSHISDMDLLASVTEDLVGFPNLSWDQAPDPFDSLQGADVLVSDKSGIVFDFAFVFRRPVISIKFDYDSAGMEASDLPGELWEETVLDKIGFQLDENDVGSLPERIHEMVANNEYEQSIQSVIESGCFNLGQAGPVSARQILDIQQEVVGSIGATSAGSSTAPTS